MFAGALVFYGVLSGINKVMINTTYRSKPLYWRVRPTEKRVLLLLGDILASSIALWVSLYFWSRGDAWLSFSPEFILTRPAWWYWILPLVWLVLMVELYDTKRVGRRSDVIRGVGTAALISFALYLVIYFTSEPNSLPRRGVAVFIIATALLTLVWRLISIKIFSGASFLRRVIIVGAGKAGRTVQKVINETQPLPYNVIGFIDDDKKKIGKSIQGGKVLGGNKKLSSIIKKYCITDIIFAISVDINPGMLQAIVDAEECGIEVITMPAVYEELMGRVPIFLLDSDWLIRSFIDQAHTSGFYELAKRIMDILGALIGLLTMTLLFPMIALGILLDSGLPIFYTQTRLGKNGAHYNMIKFRTMHRESESVIQAATHDDPRVTRFGKLLRRTHLDELPQFMNILMGDMSLVGPRAERAELVAALQKVVPFYRARLLVKPGLTGWAQINFGYASSVEDTATKLEYDLYYIKRRSVMMDIITLLRTFSTVYGFKGT